MIDRSAYTIRPNRDGTSQPERLLPALDPSYFQIEERGVADLLAYAKKYAKVLRYYNEENIEAGDWSGFLGDIDPEELAAFVQNPSFFDAYPEKKAAFSRPHLVLFLVFLTLLQDSRARINELSKKQLDFYYRKALGFTTQKAIPDHVHILAEISPDQKQVLIPEGTRLQAGNDGNGNPVHFKTNEDLVANKTQIARLMSLYVDKEVTDIDILRKKGIDENEPDNGFLSVLSLVYRKPGTANIPRNYPRNLDADTPFSQQIIFKLDTLRKTIADELSLTVAEFQRIMREYNCWFQKSNWDTLNQIMARAYENRTDNKKSLGELFIDPRNFEENFEIAFGFSFTGKAEGKVNVFKILPDVSNVYELFSSYRRNDKNRNELLKVFEDNFHLVPEGSAAKNLAIERTFKAFIKAYTRLESWISSVHHTLRLASVRKVDFIPAEWAPRAYEKDKTLANAFRDHLGIKGLNVDNDLKIREAKLNELETYFQMNAEDYYFIRDLYREKGEVPSWKWFSADRMLEKAFQEIITLDRQVDTTRSQSPQGASEATQNTAASPAMAGGQQNHGHGRRQRTQEAGPLAQKPEIIRWRNLYKAPDSTKLIAGPVTKNAQPQWKLFGSPLPAETEPNQSLHAAEIGWGFSSPTLALTEGKRELTLKLTFNQEKFNAQEHVLRQYLVPQTQGDPEAGQTTNNILRARCPFKIEISTKKGWKSLGAWPAQTPTFKFLENEPAVQLRVTAPEKFDPFEKLPEDVNGYAWPVLRLLVLKKDFYFRDENGNKQSQNAYELFKDQSLEAINLAVRVTGLRKLHIQTKEGLASAKKPFAPFGTVPQKGDRFFLNHPELARQKLDTLNLHLKWKNLPKEGLGKYYERYVSLGGQGEDLGIPTIMTESFKVELALIEARRKLALSPTTSGRLSSGRFNLFQSNADTQEFEIPSIQDQFSNDNEPYVRRSQAIANPDAEVIEADRFLEVTLQPQDFLHNVYSALLFRQGLSGTRSYVEDKTDENKTNVVIKLAPPPVLNEPFQPILDAISVDYTCSLEISWDEDALSTEDVFFHQEPFGHALIQPEGNPVPFLPSLEMEGTLHIGLEGLRPPQEISILFQLAEGSANPDLKPSPVTWSYLAGNEWVEFSEAELLQDATDGLLNSGVMKFQLGKEASQLHQRMPAGLHWIRATVDKYTDSLSRCINIHTQAVQATWMDPGIKTDHLAQPLPSSRISEPVEKIEGLAALMQPYSSFQGKEPEADKNLYRRASARLRHKLRALTLWDYEHLILEQFPDVYRAKAIPADQSAADYAPGQVNVVVIPDIHHKKPFDPFEPKMPIARLQEIEKFLQARAPAYASIRVQNARFISLEVRVAVRFLDMNNFGFYAGQLNQELREYLAPWAYTDSAEIVFGGSVYMSVIVAFIESRPYVDYIDQPQLTLIELQTDGSFEVLSRPTDIEDLITIEEPDVVLVSAHQHTIDYLATIDENGRWIRKGIGHARIEFEFRIPQIP